MTNPDTSKSEGEQLGIIAVNLLIVALDLTRFCDEPRMAAQCMAASARVLAKAHKLGFSLRAEFEVSQVGDREPTEEQEHAVLTPE